MLEAGPALIVGAFAASAISKGLKRSHLLGADIANHSKKAAITVAEQLWR